ncbi:MAG: DNA-directed RNA polymerase subunit H [Candidatus Micrarchaeota archaeon]|nr:DNA-directed RNA polymerase subunit H [Candidatus Micrarchaeota archaeon]
MPSKSDHELVPVHELMNEKEVSELLKRLGIELENLPRILDTDPQAVKLEAKAGQVIRISRKDGKIDNDYYRRVVEG